MGEMETDGVCGVAWRMEDVEVEGMSADYLVRNEVMKGKMVAVVTVMDRRGWRGRGRGRRRMEGGRGEGSELVGELDRMRIGFPFW